MAEVWIVVEHDYGRGEVIGVYDNEEAANEHSHAGRYRYPGVTGYGSYSVEHHVVESRYEPS